MSDIQSQEFRALLVKISDNIEPDDLKKMNLLCKGIIGDRDRSKIKSPIDLFDELEKKQKLKASDVTFLIYLLENGCKDHHTLLSHLRSYERQWSSSKGVSEGE